ncbi:MAG: hypothetical protein JWM68_3546 [Verrucomicrobiales bacterium]|nr:hypothetical protein [Verrucomicrobiales bacterium]
MSLARLLTTSGSVGRRTDDSHRFKMTNPLPKFAPVKRPIALTPTRTENADQHVMKTSSLFAPQNDSPFSSGSGQVCGSEEQIGVLSVGVFQKEENAATVTQAAGKSMKSETWFSKLLNIFRRKRVTPVPAPIQTEWSLDKVKVVRNDLSDVDLDIVFASVDATAPTKQAPAKKEKLVSSAWRRVSPNPQKQEQMVLK